MTSPPRRCASATASSVLPVAVGPTTTKRSSGCDWTTPRARSTADASLEVIVSNSGDDRTPVRAMPRKVDAVEGKQKSHGLLARDRVPGANASVTSHRSQHEIRDISEGSLRGAPELGHQVAHE